jgi:hypothetical protein
VLLLADGWGTARCSNVEVVDADAAAESCCAGRAHEAATRQQKVNKNSAGV